MFSFLTVWEFRKQLKQAMNTRQIVTLGAGKHDDFLARITRVGFATYTFVAVSDDEVTWQGEYTYPLLQLEWLSFADKYRDYRRIDIEKGEYDGSESSYGNENPEEGWDEDEENEEDEGDGDIPAYSP